MAKSIVLMAPCCCIISSAYNICSRGVPCIGHKNLNPRTRPLPFTSVPSRFYGLAQLGKILWLIVHTNSLLHQPCPFRQVSRAVRDRVRVLRQAHFNNFVQAGPRSKQHTTLLNRPRPPLHPTRAADVMHHALWTPWMLWVP